MRISQSGDYEHARTSASAAVCRALRIIESERPPPGEVVEVEVSAYNGGRTWSSVDVRVVKDELPRLLALLHADPAVAKTTHPGTVLWERSLRDR